MLLLERLDEDLISAMRARDEQLLSTLRMVRSACKNKQIDSGHELSDEEVITILRGMIKQYRDALADFSRAGRSDLVERQQAELVILEKYLPPQLTEEEIEAKVKQTVEIMQATAGDFGVVMGRVMKELGSQADGGVVRSIVERVLQSRAS